jgi:4-amino-4-deoxy-L-arabinose transferase-like glycosyltransferase
MRKLIYIFDPPTFIGLTMILVTLAFLVYMMARKRESYLLIIFIFVSGCSVFIMMNQVFDLIHMRIDSFDDYIPEGFLVADSLRGGPGEAISDFIKFFRTPFFLYTIPLGILFALSQNSFVAGNFLSAIFGALTIYMMYHITKDLFDQKTALLTSLLLAISPFFIFISSVMMRDTMVLFFITWFYRLWLLYEKTPTLKTKLLMIFALLCMGFLRSAIMVVVLGTAMVYKMYFDVQRSRKFFSKLFRFALVIIGIAGVLLVLSGTVDLKDLKSNPLVSGLKYTSLEGINDKIGKNLDAGSRYYPVVKNDSMVEVAKNAPLLVLYFMCAPFPWEVVKQLQYFALLDSMILWVVYFLFFLAVPRFYRQNRKWALILFGYIFLGVWAASIVQTNVGGSQRHRIMFTTFILPFAAHQLMYWWSGKKARISAKAKPRTAMAPVSATAPGNWRVAAGAAKLPQMK